jgi:hypothetical protein
MISGTYPEMVDDSDLLGPVQDAIMLYAWKYVVDRYRTSLIVQVD